MKISQADIIDELDIRMYWNILRKKAGLILLITLLSGVAGFLISNSLSPIYEASTTLLVNETSGSQTNEYTDILTSERLARTYAEIIKTQPILEAVKSSLGLSNDLSTLENDISVDLIPNTQLIQIKVKNPDPNLAQQIANQLVEKFISNNNSLQRSRFTESKDALAGQIAIQQEFIDQIQSSLSALPDLEENQTERTRLEGLLSQYRQSYNQLLQSYEQVRLSEAQSTSNVMQIEPATFPQEPISPKKLLNSVLAGVVGSIVSIGFVFMQILLDNSIKGTEDVKNNLGFPVLALVGKSYEKDVLVTAIDPRSPISEAFRTLRTGIQFASVDHRLKVLMVTSAVQGEGKTTVAANLAFVMSQLGTETILVDADLRRPKMHKTFGLSNKKGLSNLFVNKEIGKAFSSQLQDTKHAHLKVLASGGIPPNPSELISTTRMMNILELASENAGLVIVDAPPVLPVTDAVVLAQKADGVIIVMVPGQTTMPMAKQTVENLRQVNANIIGAVFNNVDLNSAYFASYRNGYRYLYDHES